MIYDKLWFCLWEGYVVKVMLIAYWVVSKLFGQLWPNESNFVREKWYQLWPSNQLNAQLTFWSRRRRAPPSKISKSRMFSLQVLKSCRSLQRHRIAPRSYPHCFLQVLSLSLFLSQCSHSLQFTFQWFICNVNFNRNVVHYFI